MCQPCQHFVSTVIRELKERFGVRAPPTYDSASVGMVENAIKQVKEKVRFQSKSCGYRTPTARWSSIWRETPFGVGGHAVELGRHGRRHTRQSA